MVAFTVNKIIQKDISRNFVTSYKLLWRKNVSGGKEFRDPQIFPSAHTKHAHTHTHSLLPSVWASKDSAADQTNKKSLFVT